MTKETERICRQMEQMISGEAWHGPCLLGALEGVTAAVAAAKPFAGMHSVWELLGHLTATQQVILERIETGADSGREWLDVPLAADATDEGWRQAIADFKDAEQRLRRAIATFDEDRLMVPLKAGGTSAYNNFHGNLQHLAYHIGQIAILKKVQGQLTREAAGGD